MFGLPLLSLIIFLPVLGILILFFIPKAQTSTIRGVSVATTLVTFLLSLLILAHFNTAQPGFQLEEKLSWIPQVNINYHVGVDGLSYSMIFLTALLCFLACFASFSIKDRIKEYFIFYLMLEVGMIGTFLALDLFLFYVFWEITLVPMYFLIGIWGGPRKEYAAIKFFLYTLAGSVLMLLCMIGIYFASGPATLVDGTSVPHTFNIMALSAMGQAGLFANSAPILGVAFSKLMFIGLFIGFAIKVPMFPFHTWLPDAHVEAPTPISVILAGVLLKMGTYGLMRISWPMFPDAVKHFQWFIALVGVVSIVYGALCALGQHRVGKRDFKKLIAYSSVSHMGFVVLGMAALNTTGMEGAILQMFNHGTITSMLFMVVGVLYDRSHTRGLDDFGGMANKMPIYTGLMTISFMAAIGLPGLSGFVSEIFVFLGAFQTYPTLTIN